jgi:uncharacterized protein (TIGR03437 family)
VAVTPKEAALAASTYTASILVSGTGTETNSTTITVTLTVMAPLPAISSVVNVASYATGSIAAGEMVAIFGTAIGPATAAYATVDPSTGMLATTAGGVQVFFNGIAAPVVYAGSTQVNTIVPYEMAPVSTPSVWITYLGQTSSRYQVTATATMPGLFTLNAQGSGPGAIVNQDNSINSPANPAAKGSVVAVYLTGEGQTSPAGVTGRVTAANLPPPQVTPAPLLPVGVLIDGQPANYIYAGEAPGFVAGMMQINVQIPADARSGEVPIVVSIGGRSSQGGATVSVR